MLLISLTGGIGTGKSTAASLLAQRGAHVLILDEVARSILDPGTAATWEVSQEWPSVVSNGVVDRGALAAIVFHDKEALARLNAITHPRTWQAAERILQRWGMEDPGGVAVLEIAILADSERKYGSHLNIVVGADTQLRLQRLEGRGLTPRDAQARIDNQRPQSELAELADVWLDNSGSHTDLARRISDVWESRIGPYAANLHAGKRVHGSTTPADMRTSERSIARLEYQGIRADVGERPGILRLIDAASEAPLSASAENAGHTLGAGTARASATQTALAAAGFVPGKGCFELADPAYQLSLV